MTCAGKCGLALSPGRNYFGLRHRKERTPARDFFLFLCRTERRMETKAVSLVLTWVLLLSVMGNAQNLGK